MSTMVAPLVLCAALVSACAIDEVDDGEVIAERVILECESWGCGHNSSFIDAVFHELHEYGARNREGFRITGFRSRAGDAYQIDVSSGQLYGLHPWLPRLEGAALKDAVITVERWGRFYDIKVMRVLRAPYFVLGSGSTMEAYELHWAITGTSQFKNLCSNPTYGSDTLGMDRLTAVLFDGERIDSATKNIGAVLDHRWFNIGCAGSALAKLALMGRVEASRAAGFAASTRDDKQALLRSIVGDYCGNGQVFTVPHEPLTWKDNRGWLVHASIFGPGPRTIEARWTAAGASCLATPRLAYSTSPITTTMFPSGIEAAIYESCGKRPVQCLDTHPETLAGHNFVTASP
jgi:hypothetical protein